MTKEEVVRRLCQLSNKVGDQAFNHKYSHDCFCPSSAEDDFRFEEPVIKWIEDAVEAKLKQLPDPSQSPPQVKQPTDADSIHAYEERLKKKVEALSEVLRSLATAIENGHVIFPPFGEEKQEWLNAIRKALAT